MSARPIQTVHAYTQATGEPYPGYVNISQAPAGGFVVTVRSPGRDGAFQASLPMTREQLLDMAAAIQKGVA